LSTQAGVQGSGTTINIAGSTQGQMTISVDGISAMNATGEGATFATDMIPSINSIEEVKINENSNSAEFAGTGAITTVSRSGKNRFTGGVFENYQSRGLLSSSPFSAVKPNLVVNDYGAYVGGPVVIPHLYNGKDFYNGHDKTFFFLSYEGLRLPQTTTETDSVPTPAERLGDFSQFYTGPSAPEQLYYPDGITKLPVNPSGVDAGQPNYLNPSTWNPIAQRVLNLYYPQQNVTSGPGYNSQGGVVTGNYQINAHNPITSNQGDVRLDQKITDKQSTYVRYSYKQVSSESIVNGGMPLNGGATSLESYITAKNTSLAGSYNYILTQNLLNEFRAGLGKLITGQNLNAVNNSSIITGLGVQGIPNPLPLSIPTVPTFNITGFTATGYNIGPSSSTTYDFIDNVTWTHGKHTFKSGMELQRYYTYQSNVFASQRDGAYYFQNGNPSSTAILLGPGKEAAVSGAEIAELALGVPDNDALAQVTLPDEHGRGNSWAWYAQDDWKPTSNLTITFGLRYEFHPPVTDKYDNFANFLPNFYASNGQGVNQRGAFVVPKTSDLNNGLNVNPAFRTAVSSLPSAGGAGLQILSSSQAGIPYGLVYPSKDDFAPRFGFAWRPLHNDKTVLRGGIGQYYVGALGASAYDGWATSSSLVTDYNNALVTGTSTCGGTSTTCPALAFPTPFSASAAVPQLIDYDLGTQLHFKDAPMEQWNLTLEQNIGFNTGLRISYLGSHLQDGLLQVNNINLNPYTAMAGVAASPGGNQTLGYEYPTQGSLPFPTLGETTMQENQQEANYNAITVDANHRLTKGLQFDSNYTYTRNLENYVYDIYNPNAFYGNVAANHRHVWKTTAVFNLPFGHGQAFLSSVNYLMNQVVGNWQLSGYYLAEDGDFLNPSVSTGTSGDPTGSGSGLYLGDKVQPDITPGVSPYAGKSATGGVLGARNHLANVTYTPNSKGVLTASSVNSYHDVMPSKSAAVPGRNGNMSPYSLIGNGTNSLSISATKGIAFTERIKFSAGVQATNILNRHDYSDPSNLNIDTPTTYGISTAIQPLRSLMLVGRLTF
jgi:TonB dependent receptor